MAMLKRTLNRLESLLASDEKILSERTRLNNLYNKIFEQMHKIFNSYKKLHPELFMKDYYEPATRKTQAYKYMIRNRKVVALLHKDYQYQYLLKQLNSIDKLAQLHLLNYRVNYIRMRLKKNYFDSDHFQSLTEKYGTHQMPARKGEVY